MSFPAAQLYHLLPAAGLLLAIYNPLLNRMDKRKFAVLCAFAAPLYLLFLSVCTTDSSTIRVLARNDTFLFLQLILQAILSSYVILLWTFLCSRWTLPCLHFNFNPRTYQLIQYVPMKLASVLLIATTTDSTSYLRNSLLLILLTVVILRFTVAQVIFQRWPKLLLYMPVKLFITGTLIVSNYINSTMDLNMILVLIFAPLFSLLWYCTGNYVAQRWQSFLICLIPSFLYTWIVLSNTVDRWQYSTTSGLFALLFSLTTLLGSYAFDKASNILDVYPNLYPVRSFDKKSPYFKQLLSAAMTPEYTLPFQPVDDLRVCVSTTSSSSMQITFSIFGISARTHMIALYGFCNVTDDMIDLTDGNNNEDEFPMRQKVLHNLQLMKQFIDQLYGNFSESFDYVYDLPESLDPAKKPKVDWDYFSQNLSARELAVFRAVSRIAYYLPEAAFRELIKCYEWDTYETLVNDRADLLLYCQYAASSVAYFMVYITCYKYGYSYLLTNENRYKLEDMRTLGKVCKKVLAY